MRFEIWRCVVDFDVHEAAFADRVLVAVERERRRAAVDEVQLVLRVVEVVRPLVARREDDRVDAERGHAERARAPSGSRSPSPSSVERADRVAHARESYDPKRNRVSTRSRSRSGSRWTRAPLPRVRADDVAGARLRRGQRVLDRLCDLPGRDALRRPRGGEPAEALDPLAVELCGLGRELVERALRLRPHRRSRSSRAPRSRRASPTGRPRRRSESANASSANFDIAYAPEERQRRPAADRAHQHDAAARPAKQRQEWLDDAELPDDVHVELPRRAPGRAGTRAAPRSRSLRSPRPRRATRSTRARCLVASASVMSKTSSRVPSGASPARRTDAYTSHPSPARRRAHASPIPDDAPVTSAAGMRRSPRAARDRSRARPRARAPACSSGAVDART